MKALTLTPPPATLIQSDRLTANTKHAARLTVYTLQDRSIQQKRVCSHTHLCVQTQHADFPGVDDLSHRVRTRPVQILLELSGLDQLP